MLVLCALCLNIQLFDSGFWSQYAAVYRLLPYRYKRNN